MAYEIKIWQTVKFDKLEDAEREYKRLCIEHDGDDDFLIMGIRNAPTGYRYNNGKVERGYHGVEGIFSKESEY